MLDKYISQLKEILFSTVIVCFVFCGLYACASLGSPGGGAYDVDPPRYVSSIPELHAVNYDKNKIEIIFDELITLKDVSEKVIITPPQIQNPIIRAQGNKIKVELRDSLLPNTTYTIDFTSAIVDNNEQNVLEGFSFAFSTGKTVDSLIISGRLLNAENLEPMPNILIGLHTNLNDSAFLTEPFKRTTKTNDKGEFWIRNVSPGTYRIFALNDLNRNYKFDQPGEAVAFNDSLIIPTFRHEIRMDTIWKDTLKLAYDSIVEVPFTHFLPDDILLFLFQENFSRQYMTHPERTEPHKFTLPFNAPVTSLPKIDLLNIEPPEKWYIPEISDGGKTISYWISDSTVYQIDTLKLKVDYLKTDSLNLLSEVTDTLKLYQRGKKPVAKPKKGEIEKSVFLDINISGNSSMDVFDTLRITFSEPLLNFDRNLIRIEEKVDTLWELRDFPILADSLNPRSFWVDKRWPYGKEYQITIDSAAFKSIYGKWSDKKQSKFKLKKEEDYGHLYVAIEDSDGIPGIGELLDASDKVVRRAILKDGELQFSNLKPGKYYLRYIVDVNGNGKWDIGNFKENRQPEPVFYYPGFFDIRQNWEIEHTWNIHEVPIEKQKPVELNKNKPQQKTNKDKYEEYNRKFNRKTP
ncbi:MAG: Ig-like domain-containing protein [Candidatus Azobacteroides sp.]|nr:Ig-like domain-containing protein [Candidatus Azobacteroides sp.]